jgi:phosphoribosylformylglycinamidine (FGAM) synthase PurS component
MINDYYFCLYLTESEHGIVEDMISKMCFKNNLKLEYYRELKDFHVPCYREIKITGNKRVIIKNLVDEMGLKIVENPHIVDKRKIKIEGYNGR